MIDANDIHYLTGFLYLHVRRSGRNKADVCAILGEKIVDEAANKPRDVDIVIATSGDTGFVGVEVKDEKRPIDIITVEQICMKLSDMPSIREKYLVSSSGFTEPAKAKAKAHGLGCLRLMKGPIQQFSTINFSELKSVGVDHKMWLDKPKPPHILLQPYLKLDDDLRSSINDDCSVVLNDGSLITLAEFKSRLLNVVLNSADIPFGTHPIQSDVLIDDQPSLRLGAQNITLTRAIVVGLATREQHDIPLQDVYCLEDSEGKPLGAAFLTEFNSVIYGMILNEDRLLSCFILPPTTRKVRPLRHRLG